MMEEDKKLKYEFTAKRGAKAKKGSTRYFGADSRVGFWVDHHILISGFSFFPPFACKGLLDTDYKVVLEKVNPGQAYCCGILTTSPSTTPVEQFTARKAENELRGHRVRVNPPHLIEIEPYQWYDIRFQINGPKTEHLDDSRPSWVDVYSSERCGNGHGKRLIAHFDFLRGSGQLPEFHFLIG